MIKSAVVRPSHPVPTMFCPEWRMAADVAIGLDPSGPKAWLDVLSCDLLLEGETCD